MSQALKNANTQPHNDHGTVRSYVTGFILSLLFTFTPYYMVVNQTVKGSFLLASIMGFAVLQLIIQVVFFLHLGRGPKPKWNLYFFISTVGIILIVVGGSVFIINNLIYNMLPSEQAKRLINDEGIYQIEGKETGACQGQHDKHLVTISDKEVSPLYTYANKCDTLIFVNEDEEQAEIVFGEYPEFEVYAGENMLTVRKGRSQAITLSESGEYQFYNSRYPITSGYFTVVPE